MISIVLPARNEEKRLPVAIKEILRFMQKYQDWEVIISENGSTDKTQQLAREYARNYQQIRTVKTTPGKGAAIRGGMLAARGDWRYMCDVDLSTPISALDVFLRMASPMRSPDGICSGGADIVIGSRNLPDSKRENEPEQRNKMGIVFNAIVQMYLLYGISDTQCGFKLFSRRAAEQIFGRLECNGWAFDVEALYLARRLGFTIYENPVYWFYNADSRVMDDGSLKTALSMLWDVIKIKRRVNSRLHSINRPLKSPLLK